MFNPYTIMICIYLKKNCFLFYRYSCLENRQATHGNVCVDIREIYDQNLTQILPSGPKISAKNDASEKVGKS